MSIRIPSSLPLRGRNANKAKFYCKHLTQTLTRPPGTFKKIWKDSRQHVRHRIRSLAAVRKDQRRWLFALCIVIKRLHCSKPSTSSNGPRRNTWTVGHTALYSIFLGALWERCAREEELPNGLSHAGVLRWLGPRSWRKDRRAPTLLMAAILSLSPVPAGGSNGHQSPLLTWS
jgi:hypothetical protein